ncbi:MAG: hypothetical protein ABJD11_18260, partial [Gemmatimonadota bacterium]
LLDLSRVLLVEDPEAPVVSLGRSDAPPAATLLAAAETGWGISTIDGQVQLPVWALNWIADLAGAGLEQGAVTVDPFERTPATENPLVASGLTRRPVVQEAARELRAAIGTAAGQRPAYFLPPWPDGHRWAAAISHDVDVIDWWPAFTGLRLVELLSRGKIGLAARVIAAAIASSFGDPVWQGLDAIMRIEAELGIRSTWFILTGTPTFATMTRGDLTYLPEGRRASRLLSTLAASGHEIGLHGSFATMMSREKLSGERERLAKLVDHSVSGVRQHYLRFRPGRTQVEMRAAGFSYDASYGFADRNGFRLGVADIVPAFDASSNRQSGAPPIDEVPLHWMDRALSKYSGIERPAAWVDDGLELAATCRKLEGLFVALWHPNLVPALGYPDALPQLRRLLESLLADRPWIRPLGEIARWRAARRSVRATGVNGDGSPRLTGSFESFGSLRLESADGGELRTVAAPGSARG